MTHMGGWMMVAGVVLAVVGAVFWLLGRVGFRGMPGDINYEGQNVRFYFPIVTSIVLSVLLTLGIWLWRWMSGK